MDDESKRILLKRYEMYSGLLKKHEATKAQHKIQPPSVSKFSYHSNWKQLSPSAYKMVKNSTQQSSYSTTKYAFNKFDKPVTAYQNIGTKFNSQANLFKAKYKITPNKNINIKIPSNKFTFQRKVLNTHSSNQSIQLDLCTNSLSKKIPCKIADNSLKVPSGSQALSKEIESLTQKLKKTSEIKSRTISLPLKDDSGIQGKLLSHKNINQNYAYSNINQNSCAFSKSKDLPKKQVVYGNLKSSLSVNKNKCVPCNDFLSVDKSKHITSINKSDSLSIAKYSYKKVNSEMFNSKVPSSPLKFGQNKESPVSNVQKITLQSCEGKVFCQSSKAVAHNLSSNVKSNPLMHDTLTVKLDLTKQPIKSNTKFSVKYSNKDSESRNKLKSFGVPVVNYTYNRYRRISGFHSDIANKNKKLINSYSRSLSVNKKNKVNTAFKIINTTLTPSKNKMKRIVLSNSSCKEISPLPVDESDPLFKYLNDSTIDKLEQDLLAISTKITATPITVENDNKQSLTLPSKMNPKMSIKKMFGKKSKAKISKYKIINSNFEISAFKNKQGPIKGERFKKVNSKFSLVNKHVQPNSATPIKQGKSVLVKRLFKSKKAIINKNTSPINHSAKMIKSKYFTANKRKLPYEKLGLYPKVPLFQSRSKGYFSTKTYYRKNRYQKAPVLSHRQKVIRRNLYNGCHKNNVQFRKYAARSRPTKKLPNGYVCSSVFIQGVKYSLNSSGKTLRKLPSQDFGKFHRKFSYGKEFRTSDNRIKTVTPISMNLASRVLHRSITRALSATSKKSLTKVNTYCMFYNRFGRCNRGVKCTYIHDPSKIAVCTRYLRGTCKIDGCPFSHEITPGKMAICSFFLVGACDKDNCPYRHEKLSPNAQLCKAFVQGYCQRGKECKNAHILICPDYVQGNCEKGTACAFPHPPRKEKKHVPKEIEEVKKTDDTLLEKVERYFQLSKDTCLHSENKSDENIAKVFVPKQRRLEEQPSFIPLFDSPALLNNS